MSYSRGDIVAIAGLVFVHQTDNAMKVKFIGEDDKDGVWIPKSKCEGHSFTNVGDEGYVSIPFWMAEEKNLDGAIDDDQTDDDDTPPL